MQTHEGHDPLVWEDDDLTRIRELHARSFSDKDEYLRSRNLAEYLGLGVVDQLHLPLPLHIVFIGFQVGGRRPCTSGAQNHQGVWTEGPVVNVGPGWLERWRAATSCPARRLSSCTACQRHRTLHSRRPSPLQGDGNSRVRLDEMTLTEWFAHIDHLMPHTRVSLAELTCVDDGGCQGGPSVFCRLSSQGPVGHQ